MDNADIDIRAQQCVLSHPQSFKQAGLQLEKQYSPEHFWQADLNFYKAQTGYSGRLPTLESWQSPAKRAPKIVERLLELYRFDRGMPSADKAAQVVLMHWILTDQECNNQKVKVTTLQDWSIPNGADHQLMRAHAHDSAENSEWREYVVKSLAVMQIHMRDDHVTRWKRQMAKAYESIERPFRERMKQMEDGVQETLNQWESIARRFIPNYDIRKSPVGDERLTFLLCKYANVQPSEALNHFDLGEFFRWLEMAADERDRQLPAKETADSKKRKPAQSRKQAKMDWLAKAMLIVKQYPDWPDVKIAEEVGRNPGTLSRSQEYQEAAQRAREHQPVTGRIERGRGGGTLVEAFAEDREYEGR